MVKDINQSTVESCKQETTFLDLAYSVITLEQPPIEGVGFPMSKFQVDPMK